ncbi:WD40 repeat-like protein [Dacryopinax primogenitus]|uniref:WD40 repeat-like protein n=1 Tax=Dacryopinax primogenitus (strain DJM 731) TaxID=1858805 RepID=M5G0I1_DACPD|nr:WD40 repeat-like protein [Dacryopinax primogenitus]EJU02244.1 WD40 repeat-like protein [Dacryopinax primogenitus]
MSFTQGKLCPCNPTTERGVSTKLSATGSKLVYTNGSTVVIRDLADPAGNSTYAGHIQPATVARFSPSGYYCASGDVAGNVRVWDTVGADRILKNEVKTGIKINDLEWDGESKRIIAVGDGKSRMGSVFTFDTGNSAGEIMGHSKPINAVSIRHQRPFRAVTASDDAQIAFFEGAPYKYKKSIKTHTRFVQDVRYAPSGDLFASGGSDGKVFLYDGKTGDVIIELKEGAHSATVMACSWSTDSKSLATSSTDGTVKLWDAETHKIINTWTVGTGIHNQQVGNTWVQEDIVSLSLSGDLSVFDRREAEKPRQILYGAQRPITAFTAALSGTMYAGSYDGRVVSFSDNGAESVKGDGPSSQVTALAAVENKVISTSFDDCVREIDLGTGAFTLMSVGTNGQPKDVACDMDGIYVITSRGLECIKEGKVLSKTPVGSTPSSVATSATLIAVGAEDQKVYLFEKGADPKEVGKLESNRGMITALAFSPSGQLLAAGDSTGRIVLYDVENKEVKTSRWTFHTGRISSIAWTQDGKHAASGSLDTNIYIWSVDKPMSNIAIKNAGTRGVSGVAWVSPNIVASAGADGCVRTWEIKFHD